MLALKTAMGSSGGLALNWNAWTGEEGTGEVFQVNPPGYYHSCCALSETKSLVVYLKSSYYAFGSVLSRTDTSLSVGPPAWVGSMSGVEGSIDVCALSSTKALLVYRGYGGGNYGKARVLTITGTSIAYGSEYSFTAHATSDFSVSTLASDKAIVVFDNDAASTTHARVLNITGVAVTGGTAVEIQDPSDGDVISVSAISATKAIVCYPTSTELRAMIMTVSGDTITTYASLDMTSTAPSYVSVCSMGANNAVVVYKSGSSSYFRVLDTSGTVPTSGSATIFETNTVYITDICAMTATQAIVAYTRGSGSPDGYACVIDLSAGAGTPYAHNYGETAGSAICRMIDSRALVVYSDAGFSVGKILIGQ